MSVAYPLKLGTFRAVYRLAARPYALSVVAAGAGRTQLATLHHAATSNFEVSLRHVWVAIESVSAAGIVTVDLVGITTAPATGNPAIAIPAVDSRNPADVDTIALALPTTPGTEGRVLSSAEWNLGITGAASAANPPPPLTYIDLLSHAPGAVEKDDVSDFMSMAPVKLDGFAVVLDVSIAMTVKAHVIIEYTREVAGP